MCFVQSYQALIDALVCPDETKRMGAGAAGMGPADVATLKADAWFGLEGTMGGGRGRTGAGAAKGQGIDKPFDWTLLAQGRLKPPVRPTGGMARVRIA